jgi:hypothetical protein
VSRLEEYRFGRVLVDGREETRDLIVLPERVVREWWRRDGHALVPEDLEDVIEELPERLVIGTGADGRMVPDPSTLEALRARNIRVDVKTTDRAVELFAGLDPATTAAALHLTC